MLSKHASMTVITD